MLMTAKELREVRMDARGKLVTTSFTADTASLSLCLHEFLPLTSAQDANLSFSLLPGRSMLLTITNELREILHEFLPSSLAC